MRKILATALLAGCATMIAASGLAYAQGVTDGSVIIYVYEADVK